MLSEGDLELIERYLEDSISEQEQEVFDLKKSSSEEFANQVAFQNTVLNQMVLLEQKKQKEGMLADFRSVSSKKNPSKTGTHWFAYAAAASVILALTYFVGVHFKPESNEELFLSYFEPYDGVVVTRGEEDLFEQGLREYADQNYQAALETFAKTSIDSINSDLLNLLKGNCYLQLGNVELGLQSLALISDEKTNLSTTAGNWYQALAYLRNDEIDKSRILLNELINSKSIYSFKAKKLLEESLFDRQ